MIGVYVYYKKTMKTSYKKPCGATLEYDGENLKEVATWHVRRAC